MGHSCNEISCEDVTITAPAPMEQPPTAEYGAAPMRRPPTAEYGAAPMEQPPTAHHGAGSDEAAATASRRRLRSDSRRPWSSTRQRR